MARFWPYLLLAALAFAAPVGAEEEPPGDDPGGLEGLESLKHLKTVPLPGEGAMEEGGAVGIGLGELRGRTVSDVVAPDAPAGFQPVEDADIPLGIPLDASLVRQAMRRLWDTGAYSDVQVYAYPGPGGSAVLAIEVKPMFRFRKLEVKGNDAFGYDEVARAVGYAPDRTVIPEPEVLRKLKRKLEKAYQQRGYREARANLRLETTKDPGGVALVVEIEEGRPERYTRVRMPGLPVALDDKYFAESVGLPAGMVRDREKVEKGLRQLVERLAQEGYRDAKIKQFRERRLDRYDVELVIPMEAGIHTKIVFDGHRRFRATRLEEILVGDGLMRTTPESFAQGLNRIRDHYRAAGMFHVRLQAVRYCAEPGVGWKVEDVQEVCGEGGVDQRLEITVAEGPAVEVARLYIEGNVHFSDAQLEEELFAFVKESHEDESIFQPATTATTDDLGLSDKRPEDVKKPRGSAAPRIRRARTYVPEVYLEGMEHLKGVYQEQGYLAAEVSDTCAVDQLPPRRDGKLRFRPFTIDRLEEGEPVEGGEELRPCVMIDEDGEALAVTITVVEGPQTRLSEISFEGNRVFAARALQEIAGLSVTQPYNEYRLIEASREVTAFYQSKGYMFAETSFDKSFSPDMERAKVVFRVEEGPEVRVGRIRVEGAESTSTRLIRERLTLRRGKLLTPGKIEESQQRLMELGILDSATIQMVSPEIVAGVKNLKVQVTEGKPQYLELRGGMATVEGLRGGFEYGYRNLAGWAMNARLRVRGNYRLFFLGNESPVISAFEDHYRELGLEDQIERHVLIGLGQPHLPGTRGLLGWGVDGINERVNEPAFSADRTTGFVRLNSTHALGKKYRRAIVAEVRTGIELTTLDVLAAGGISAAADESEDRTVNPVYQPYLRMPDGESLFWVTGLKLSFDLRDHPFNPTRGIMLSLGGDLVRSLGQFAPVYRDLETGDEVDPDDVSNLGQQVESGQIIKINRFSQLIRASATLSGYIPFGETQMVLALSLSVGYVFHLADNSTTWADRYFYVGGVDTLRGFPEESLVPEDIYQAWKETLRDSSDEAGDLLRSSGGEAMFIGRAEFRYPLAKGFFGAFFGEVGNLWRERKNMNLFDTKPVRINLRPVAGGGLRYITPLGPLSFDLGVNLFQRPHEEQFAWYFSIGSAF